MNYKGLDVIGQGGFGIVDKVVNEDSIVYARKTFHVNQGPTFPADMIENVRKRFVREANVQSALKHQNIVPVVDKYLGANPPYFIMPLADSTLEKDIISDKTLGGSFMNPIMDIIAGLEELHPMRIFHRDLKPANVLRFFNSMDSSSFYAITDFGLMSIAQTNLTSLTKTGMGMGSDYYTAPEVVADIRKASAQSDIFSIGCILHDLVGKEPRVPLHEIKESSEFGGILLNCTRDNPSRRFKSVIALRDALLSLGTVAIEPTTSAGAQIFETLAKPIDTLVERDWNVIVNFVDDKYPDYDAVSTLRQISIEHITDLMTRFPNNGGRLGMLYANWIREHSFQFEECDGLSIRLQKFVEWTTVDVQAECLMAMLYLGTKHNRWYVERKFAGLVSRSLSDDLAARLAIEFRVDGEDTCSAIRHLSKSIDFNKKSLHPLLLNTVNEIC
jgi:serine/threonine protein kinase